MLSFHYNIILSNKITINNIIKYAIKVNIRERHPYFVQMS